MNSRASALEAQHLPTRKIDRAPSHNWRSLVYFLIGQAAWFACVLSAARGLPWLGTMLVSTLVALHVWRAARPIEEFKLLLSVVFIGAVWESVLVFSGAINYPSGMLIPRVAPYWIPALWALFAAQFNTTYRWLKTRIWLAPIVGAIAGPLSFRAGAELGALNFGKPLVAAMALAGGWAILLPVIVVLSRRWDGLCPNRQ